jgi:hypothetical protein
MIPQIRCSSLDRVLSCSGSLTVNAIVEPRDGDDGVQGTALHWGAHWRIKAEMGASGDIGPKPPGDYPRDQWISDFYVRHVMESTPASYSLECEAALAYFFEPEEPRLITQVMWEDGRPVLRQVPYNGFTLSGHIDCLALSPDCTHAIGWDLKTGYDPVDCADSNWQILGYCVLLKRAYPELKSVTFYIVQPRNDEDGDSINEPHPRVSMVTITDLDAAVTTLASRIAEAISKPLELNTTIKGCKFCVGCSCLAIRAKQKLMRLTMTEESLAQLKAQPDDATLAEFIIGAKELAKPTEDAKAMLNDRLDRSPSLVAEDGTVITRVVQKGAWKVNDDQAFFRAMRELLPADEQIARVTKPSMTALKDEIAVALKVPKTSRAGVSAASIFDSTFAPLATQGVRNLVQFSQ